MGFDTLNRRARMDAEPLGEGTVFDAVVARQVLALGDEVFVTIGELDGSQNLVPCTLGAGPRTLDDGSVVLPTIGDAALVMVSSDGDHWITSWTPS